MVQMGFFDIAKRYAGLDAKNDPLARIDEVVLWAAFRPRLETVWRRRPEERKSPAGRKPWDAVVMFKAIVLCELYSLSDDQVEYQLRDRLSFMRFLGLGLEDKVPDAKTVWLYPGFPRWIASLMTFLGDFAIKINAIPSSRQSQTRLTLRVTQESSLCGSISTAA